MAKSPDQKICDIMLVYCQEDHQMAVKFCDILRKFITLKDGRHPDIKMWQATTTSETCPVQTGLKSASSEMCSVQGGFNDGTRSTMGGSGAETGHNQCGFNSGTFSKKGMINTVTYPLQSGLNTRTCPNQGRLDRGIRPIQSVLAPRECPIHGGLNPGTCPRKSGTCPTKSGTCPTKSGTCPTKSGTCPTKSRTCPTTSGTCPTQSNHGGTCPTQAIPRSAKYSLRAKPSSTMCSTDSIPMSVIYPKQMTPSPAPKPIVRACAIQDMLLCACVTQTNTSCPSRGQFCEECVSEKCVVCGAGTGSNPTTSVTSVFTESDSADPSDHETLAQCCCNVGPPSATLAHHHSNIDDKLSCLNVGPASGDAGPALGQHFVNRLRHFQTELASSHFVFLFVNTRFMTDSWAQLQSEECVLQGMYDVTKRDSLVPIYPSSASRSKSFCGLQEIPVGWRTVKGIDLQRFLKGRLLNSVRSASDISQSDVDKYLLQNITQLLNSKINH